MNLAPSVTRDARESPPQPCVNGTRKTASRARAAPMPAPGFSGGRLTTCWRVIPTVLQVGSQQLPRATANLVLADVRAGRLRNRRKAATGTIFEDHPLSACIDRAISHLGRLGITALRGKDVPPMTHQRVTASESNALHRAAYLVAPRFDRPRRRRPST
jgi:hypothetical protein